MASIVPLLILAFIVVQIFLPDSTAKKRRRRFSALASQRGLDFAGEPPQKCIDPAFHLFQSGHDRRASNLMGGSWHKLSLLVFDYEYTVGDLDEARTHQRTVALVELPVEVPYLSVHPRGTFEKIRHFLGLPDMQIDSTEFSQRFHLKSNDGLFARGVLNAEVTDFLLSAPGDVSFELCNGRMLVERAQQPVPQGVEQLMQFAKELSRRLPREILDQFRP